MVIGLYIEENISAKPVSQKINAYSYKDDRVENAKRQKTFNIKGDGIDYHDDAHSDKKPHKRFFFSTLHNLPDAPHIINSTIKRIMHRILNKYDARHSS